MSLDARENQLTRLPVLPPKLERLDVNHNRLTSLTVFPGLRELDADDNELRHLSVLPKTLEDVSLDGIDLDVIPLEIFQYLEPGTKVRIREQSNAALQAELESLMKNRGLDVLFLDIDN
ncbi:hypothetical protein DDE05_40570 [Streptomyces cavourensis]|nr:hypothetical protein DDE05_40570 [Streptomyces cavourensis]